MKSVILVGGGGPAGLGAAISAAAHGADVTLVDEGSSLGGSLTYRHAEDSPAIRERLEAEAINVGVVLESNAVVWGIFANDEAVISQGGSSRRVAFDRAILATGSTDRVVSFAGSSLPGVFTTRALQILMHRHRVLPGRRLAVIGPQGDEISRDVELSGGVIVVRNSGEHPGRLTASGENGVDRLIVDGIEHQVDLIVLAFGKVPDPRLAIMAECAVEPGDAPGAFVPLRDQDLRTTNPSIFAAGEIAGSGTLLELLAEGRFAGIAAAASLGLVSEIEIEAERRRFENGQPRRSPSRESGRFVQFAGQGARL